jgi:hypothetical protein
MSRAMNINLSEELVRQACQAVGAEISVLEKLEPTGIRLVCTSAEGATAVRHKLRTKMIEGPVKRSRIFAGGMQPYSAHDRTAATSERRDAPRRNSDSSRDSLWRS